MKQFLEKKEKGFWFSVLAIILFAAGLVFFRMLTAVSFETTERPVLVILTAFAAVLFSLIASYKDFGKVPSILAYAAATVAFFILLEGRASYLAFYFSGDVMNTGLSPFMVASFACFLLGMIAALLAVVFELDKGGRPRFETADLKVVIPMLCVVGILALVVSFNTAGNNSEAVSSQTVQNTAAEQTSAEPAVRYLTPNTSEEVWQEYKAKDFVNEDVSKKTIAYQLLGDGEVDAGGPVAYHALLTFYENGMVQINTFGRGNAFVYYGYWTNVDDENLWFCVMYYSALGMGGQFCTIDYSYDLTGHFDEITMNVALGLADGGQFVRQIPAGGDGSVKFASAADWYKTFDYDMPEVTYAEPEKETAENATAVSAAAGNDILFPFTADVESFKLDLYPDNTYKFQFTSMNLEEAGTWEWKDWALTLTTPSGKTYSCTPDAETHALNLTFAPDISDQLVRNYTAESSVWGVAFNGEGTYTAGTAASTAAAAEAELLVPFTADAESFKLDLYSDGTYKFQFTSMNLEESGTWEWKDWTLTLTTPGGKVASCTPDGETHALNIHFVPDISDQLERDYTAESSVWGVAFNGQGNYPA